MKKTIFNLFLVALLAITACQQTPEPLPIDLEAEEAALSDLFDKFYNAYLTKDADSLAVFLSEDFIVLGSDLNQVYDRETTIGMWKQMFDAGLFIYEPFGELLIKLAPDGKSATVIEQYMMPAFSEILPIRNSYHVIKIEDKWEILLINTAITPKDEDMPIINAALASE